MFTGRSADQFLAERWQKAPQVIRGGLADWRCPIDGDTLAGLSLEDDVASRIIRGPDEGGSYTVSTGPFDEATFSTLGETHWTLLVQDVEKWVPDFSALVDRFSFLPRWRIDDVMVSVAAPGGSVGAHVDQYDVFLIQAAGHRRWMIDASDEPDLSPALDGDLDLLKHFKPSHDFVLEAGDVLYLPPGIPHHGIALDAHCMTVSLGMRAPSVAQMLGDFAGAVVETLGEKERYRDPDLAATSTPLAIDRAQIRRARSAVFDALANVTDDEFAHWFGGFVTRYRLPDLSPDAHTQESLPERVVRSPWSRWALVNRPEGGVKLFVDGEAHSVAAEDAERFSASVIATTSLTPDGRRLAESLYREGRLESLER